MLIIYVLLNRTYRMVHGYNTYGVMKECYFITKYNPKQIKQYKWLVEVDISGSSLLYWRSSVIMVLLSVPDISQLFRTRFTACWNYKSSQSMSRLCIMNADYTDIGENGGISYIYVLENAKCHNIIM
mgnify:FL=1